VNGHGARASGVWRKASVQREGVEAWIGVTGHGVCLLGFTWHGHLQAAANGGGWSKIVGYIGP
jgi:hypothetical protein